MRLSFITTCAAMSWRELWRQRIVMVLLVVVPSVFYAVVALTTPTTPIAFKLAAIGDDV